MKLAYDDKWHKYRLDGKQCVNISKLAEIPDDKEGLNRWFKRSIVRGLAADETLHRDAVKEYGGENQDRVFQALGEKALNASRDGGDAAQRGTDLHKLFEDVMFGGREPLTAEERAFIDTARKALDAAGIELDPAYSERILVYPSDKIAGRTDDFVTVKRRKGHFVFDLKTGKVDYPHKFAVQLGVYANAHLAAGELNIRGETEQFEELPEMNTRDGYILHMPTCYEASVLKVDIAAGYETFRKIVLPTLKWRRTKASDLLDEVVTVAGTDPMAHASIELHDMIRDRLARIKEHDETPGTQAHPSGVNLTRARWPRSVPPRGPWTNSDIDKLDTLLTNVEKHAGVSF